MISPWRGLDAEYGCMQDCGVSPYQRDSNFLTMSVPRGGDGSIRAALGRLLGRSRTAASVEPCNESASVRGETRVVDTPLFIVGIDGKKTRPALKIGTRIYVVGDIHGQVNCLAQAVERIACDANARPIESIVTVFVGDYVDKGLASKEVIETLINEHRIGSKVMLRGNHEEMMVSALNDISCMKKWCAVGGIQTLFSYGVDVREVMIGRGYEAAQVAFAKALPSAHLAWLQGLLNRYEHGDYFFCHAGINPDKPINEQEARDLLWIRGKFTENGRIRTKIVVHGHSPVERFEVKPNRINVDTGAFTTGKLACVALEADRIVVL